jgi:hypothetical protein
LSRSPDEFSLDLSQLVDPVGLSFRAGGQTYRVVGTRARHNGDIDISWRTRCATCGTLFEVTTPRSRIYQPARRCPAHRAPGRPAAAELGQMEERDA